MRDVLRRLERLEQATPAASDVPRLAVRFVDDETGVWNPRAARYDGETISRTAHEPADAFEARAFDHFAPMTRPRCALVVVFD